MTRDDIQRVMDTVPGLNYFGIGVFDPLSKSTEQQSAELRKGKQDLLNSIAECDKVAEWLKRVEKIKTMTHNSYHLKHCVERDMGGHVSNGVFITVAIHAGFAYRTESGSANVLFGVSNKSLKALRKESVARMDS